MCVLELMRLRGVDLLHASWYAHKYKIIFTIAIFFFLPFFLFFFFLPPFFLLPSFFLLSFFLLSFSLFSPLVLLWKNRLLIPAGGKEHIITTRLPAQALFPPSFIHSISLLYCFHIFSSSTLLCTLRRSCTLSKTVGLCVRCYELCLCCADRSYYV